DLLDPRPRPRGGQQPVAQRHAAGDEPEIGERQARTHVEVGDEARLAGGGEALGQRFHRERVGAVRAAGRRGDEQRGQQERCVISEGPARPGTAGGEASRAKIVSRSTARQSYGKQPPGTRGAAPRAPQCREARARSSSSARAGTGISPSPTPRYGPWK